VRTLAAWSLRRHRAAVSIEGAGHLPRDGAVLIVAHHYHHLQDGAVVLARLARPVHILVALDWVPSRTQRVWMERACRSARWPVILRRAQLTASAAYDPAEFRRYLRAGVRDAVALLREGRVVVIFPEGLPVIDAHPRPGAPPVRDAEGFLPFAAGFRTLATLAARDPALDLHVVPLGFGYQRTARGWIVRARLGAPLPPDVPAATVERAVRELSR